MSKIYRRPATAPVFKTNLCDGQAQSTNRIVGDLIGDKVYCIEVKHTMRSGYVGRGFNVDKYGKERLGGLRLVGRMFQAEHFDKSTADYIGNQLAAQGCAVTIKKIA